MNFENRARVYYFSTRTARYLGIWKPVGNKLTVFPDDRFQIGYPKSGNTWLRFLIANALVINPMDFFSIQGVFPDVYSVNERTLVGFPAPRLIHAHFRCQVLDDYLQNPDFSKIKVIYIVRDPRDVAISMYYWLHKTGAFAKNRKYLEMSHYSLEDYLHYFPEKEKRFGGWGEHVRNWIEMTKSLDDRVLLLRYEDIKKHPQVILKNSLKFLGFKVSAQAIDLAVEKSSPENMRKGEIKLPKLVMRVLGKEDIPFVRAAKSGGWKNIFDDELNQIYRDKFGQLMERLDYTF